MRFRNYLLSNFPFLEDDFDALTDYQLFCKMIAYVKKIYINNEKFVTELTSNLEKMYEDGKFDSLIEEIANLQTTFTFDTVSDMKSATNLINGCYTKTLGYNTIYDGGNSYYKIRNIRDDDTVDEVFIIEIDENLVAELIVLDSEVNVKQSGLTGLSTEDATDKLAILVASGYDLYFPNGVYNTTSQLNITCHNLRGSENSIIKYNDSQTNRQLIETDGITKLNISNLIFDCGNATDSTKTAVNLYNSNDIKIKDCEFKNGYGGHLRLNGSDNVLIENCNFHDISGTSGNMGNAIYCHPVTNLTIRKCTCSNLMEDFLYLDGDDTHIVKNVLVDNCYLHDTSHNNPSLVSHCIGINGYCENVTVCNSIITNNGNGIRCQGRYGFKPNNVFIYGNRCSDNIQNGLYITATNCFIHDNVVYNNSQDGVYILNSENVNFNSNIVYNSTRYGIWCRNSNYLSINDCRVYDNTSTGIALGTDSDNPCNHVTITNCEVYKTETGTQGTGIQMLYGDDVKVLSCHSYNNIVNWDMHRVGVTNYVSQLNPAYAQSGVNSIIYGSAIPTNGTYNVGDIILFKTPTAGGSIGAVCVTAGSPGTWKTFGTISS